MTDASKTTGLPPMTAFTAAPAIGQEFEAAGWFQSGDRRVLEKELGQELADNAGWHGVYLGPVCWVEMEPGDDRAPEMPEHFDRGVRLLLGTARVVGFRPQEMPPAHRITGDLGESDLIWLREATRRAYHAARPAADLLSDDECDAAIDHIGFESRLRKAAEDEDDSDPVH